MTNAARLLEDVQLAVFLVVAAMATVRWIRRRGPARAWLAATFGLLGVVVLAGQILGDDPDTNLAAQKALVCVLLLFPYFLYRFMATFERPPLWLERAAAGLVLAVLAATLLAPRFPQPDEPRPAWTTAYVVLILVEWTFLSGAVSVRLWRAARGQPTVARRRMRLLGAGAAALAFALIIAGVAPSNDAVTAVTIVTAVIAIVSALLFLAGFAPPASLLRSWRARDIEAMHAAFVDLAQATSPEEVIDGLLPRVVGLVGAEGAAIYAADGRLLGRAGRTRGDVTGMLPIAPGITQLGADHLSVSVPGGRLEVFTTRYTPYFGRDELDLLQTVGALLYVTLERTYAHTREVAAREALDDAQRIAHLGSWRLDLGSGRLDVSDEMYRLYGLEPQSEPLTRERVRQLVHPDDRGTSAATEHAIATGEGFENEFRVLLPDGTQRWLAARGKGIADDNGTVVALIGTCQDVTEARRLDRMRQEFVANAAHELRTPLTTVSAMASLLASQRADLSVAELDNAFEALGRQGRRARELVTSLLDLSRIDAGRVPVQFGPTNVADVVTQALETAPPPVTARVTMNVSPDIVALADADRLGEIVVNLLTNAYRYGGPTVCVESHNGGSRVQLVVTDDGNGVPAAFVDELFEPFSRAGGVTGTPGSGLGLAIARRLAVALGGELGYEPAETGSRFILTLRAGQ